MIVMTLGWDSRARWLIIPGAAFKGALVFSIFSLDVLNGILSASSS